MLSNLRKMEKISTTRHSRECGNPGRKQFFKKEFKAWIPAFAPHNKLEIMMVQYRPLLKLLIRCAGMTTFSLLQSAFGSETPKLIYPPARAESVQDIIFNTPVNDPYRWLENNDSPEVKAWVEAENTLARQI